MSDAETTKASTYFEGELSKPPVPPKDTCTRALLHAVAEELEKREGRAAQVHDKPGAMSLTAFADPSHRTFVRLDVGDTNLVVLGQSWDAAGQSKRLPNHVIEGLQYDPAKQQFVAEDGQDPVKLIADTVLEQAEQVVGAINKP